MPKKINVVSLSDFKERDDDTQPSGNDEVELNKIKEEINKEEEIKPEPTIEEVVQTKQKRAKPPAKKAKVVVEESTIVEAQPSSVEEVIEEKPAAIKEDVKPKVLKERKQPEYIECPKCNKRMLKKSFRYNHEQTCQGKPREEIPVKRRASSTTPSQPKPNKNNYENIPITSTPIIIPEEIIQKEIQKRLTQQKENRIKAKHEHYQRLGKQIV